MVKGRIAASIEVPLEEANPMDALAALLPKLPLMGITRVSNITGLDRVGIAVAAATRPQSRSLSVAQGKGLTLEAAKISAIMEAAECFHAERIEAPVVYGSAEAMSTRHRCVDLSRLPWFVAEGYRPDCRMLWIEGTDLATSAAVWVPLQCVHTVYTSAAIDRQGPYTSTSGLAAGFNHGAAVAHGIAEIVERDAAILFDLLPECERLPRKLDLSTVHEQPGMHLIGMLRRAGLGVAIWDMTSDIGLASFACVIGDPTTEALGVDLAGGYACHPDRSRALAKAILEAAQSRLTAIAGSREDLDLGSYSHDGSRREAAEHLLLQDGCRRYDQVVDQPWSANADVDEWMVRHLGSKGYDQIVAVDLTKPQIGISVVKIVIPGLETALGPSESVAGPGMRRRGASS